MPIKVNCNFCGEELFREPNQIRTREHHYCDRKCLSNSKKNAQEIECSWCNQKLVRPACQIKKNTTGRFFCGFDCRSLFYKKDYKVTCVVCEIDFEKVPAEQNRYPVHCCSVECRNQYNNKCVDYICDECGIKLRRPPSLFKNKTNAFCTQDCFDRFQNHKTRIRCDECGKIAWKSPSAMKKPHHFCSQKCFMKFSFPESQMEVEFEKLVKDLGISYDRNIWSILKGASCNNKDLELDFYFPTIKFAVEINGISHYKPIYGEKTFSVRKRNDRLKKEKCKDRGIILRVIKPGDCKRETYMPRYKRAIWEIKQCINIQKK